MEDGASQVLAGSCCSDESLWRGRSFWCPPPPQSVCLKEVLLFYPHDCLLHVWDYRWLEQNTNVNGFFLFCFLFRFCLQMRSLLVLFLCLLFDSHWGNIACFDHGRVCRMPVVVSGCLYLHQLDTVSSSKCQAFNTLCFVWDQRHTNFSVFSDHDLHHFIIIHICIWVCSDLSCVSSFFFSLSLSLLFFLCEKL